MRRFDLRQHVRCQYIQNFYYCRFHIDQQDIGLGCQYIQNFYYCRFANKRNNIGRVVLVYTKFLLLQIPCPLRCQSPAVLVYTKFLLLQIQSLLSLLQVRCQYIQNFYYCRFHPLTAAFGEGVSIYKISTIVDNGGGCKRLAKGISIYKISTIVDTRTA